MYIVGCCTELEDFFEIRFIALTRFPKGCKKTGIIQGLLEHSKVKNGFDSCIFSSSRLTRASPITPNRRKDERTRVVTPSSTPPAQQSPSSAVCWEVSRRETRANSCRKLLMDGSNAKPSVSQTPPSNVGRSKTSNTIYRESSRKATTGRQRKKLSMDGPPNLGSVNPKTSASQQAPAPNVVLRKSSSRLTRASCRRRLPMDGQFDLASNVKVPKSEQPPASNVVLGEPPPRVTTRSSRRHQPSSSVVLRQSPRMLTRARCRQQLSTDAATLALVHTCTIRPESSKVRDGRTMKKFKRVRDISSECRSRINQRHKKKRKVCSR